MWRPSRFITACLAASAGAGLAGIQPAIADLTWNPAYNLANSGASAANGTNFFQNANWTDSTTGLAFTGTLATGTAVGQPMFVNDGYLTSIAAATTAPLRLGAAGSLTVTGGHIRFTAANLSSIANDITNNGSADATGRPAVNISGGRVWVSAVRDVEVTLSGAGSLRLGGNSSTANATGANGDPISHTSTVNITSPDAKLEFGRKPTSAVVTDHVNTGEILVDNATPVLGFDPAVWEPGDTAVITTVAYNQYPTFTTVRKQTAAYGSCVVGGSCTITYAADCSGAWTADGSCNGSCTVSGICTPVRSSAECAGAYVMGGGCDPALFQPADAGFEAADVSTTYGNGTTGFTGTAGALNTQVSTWVDSCDFSSQVVVADGTTIPGAVGNKWGRVSLPVSVAPGVNPGGLWTRIGNYDPSHGPYTIALDVGDRLNTTFNLIGVALYVGNFPPTDNIVPGELGGTPFGAPGVTTNATAIWGSETTAARTASILVTVNNTPASGEAPQIGDALWVLLYNNNSGAVALIDNVAVAGSCCSVDGSCAVTREESCTGTSSWSIGGTCSPNTCPLPLGECCVSGVCSITSSPDCTASSGLWTLGGTCSPNPCTAPTGSCCTAGSCAISTQAGCLGSWTSGGICSPNPCPAQCCVPDGTCTIVVESACGGVWTSAGTTCSPNPCPQPTGSCCVGTACTVVAQSACGGNWTMFGTCTPNICAFACCDAVTLACTVLAAGDTCGGASAGLGSTCTPTPCPPPANDSCLGALMLSVGSVIGHNNAATNETLPTCNGLSAYTAGVWYRFTPNDNHRYRVGTCDAGTLFNSRVGVYRTSDCSTFTCVAGNSNATSALCPARPDSGVVTFCAAAGVAYYIVVASDSTTTGTFVLSVEDLGDVCPPNDECANAIPIAVGGSYPGSTTFASSDTGPICNTLTLNTPGVWYTFTETSPTPRRLKLSVCDPITNFDARLFLYTGSCDALSCVWANDTSGLGCPIQGPGMDNNGTSHTTTPVIINWTPGTPAVKCTAPGTTYYICVANAGATGGNFVLHLEDTGETCEGTPPAHNQCTSARPLTAFPTWDDVFLGDALPSQDVSCNNPANTVSTGALWYTFTPGVPGSFYHSTIPDNVVIPGVTGTLVDSILTVFTASPDCTALTEIACSDTTEGYRNLFTTPVMQMSAGTTYYILYSLKSDTAALPGATALGFNFIPDPGACCTAGVCSISANAADCAGGGGSFQGVGSGCSPDPCSVAADGACCCGSACLITAPGGCTGPGRTFAGSGTACTPFSFTAPCCRGDYNKNASGPPISVQDIFDFLTGYFSTDPCANTNDSGGANNGISVQDIFDFLTAYFGGGC